ncbi:hypothetical protein BaRGS_00013924 [Batillaria attramentaria]|uniref:Uncharacterized protein n=1 Tax=Batillaria attramentaria TaxID=370345 RepID=A0ABD0L613_9CAEN
MMTCIYTNYVFTHNDDVYCLLEPGLSALYASPACLTCDGPVTTPAEQDSRHSAGRYLPGACISSTCPPPSLLPRPCFSSIPYHRYLSPFPVQVRKWHSISSGPLSVFHNTLCDCEKLLSTGLTSSVYRTAVRAFSELHDCCSVLTEAFSNLHVMSRLLLKRFQSCM